MLNAYMIIMKKSIITKIALSISFLLACGNSFAILSMLKMPTPLKTIIFSKKSAATAATLAALTIFDRTILERTPLFNSIAERAVHRYVQNDANKKMYEQWLRDFLAKTISWQELYFSTAPPQFFSPENESSMSYSNIGYFFRKKYLRSAQKIKFKNPDELIYVVSNALGNRYLDFCVDDFAEDKFNAMTNNMADYIKSNWERYKKAVSAYVQHLKKNCDTFYITLNPTNPCNDTTNKIKETFAVPGYNFFGTIVSAIYWATDNNNPEHIFAKQLHFRWRIYGELLAKMIDL